MNLPVWFYDLLFWSAQVALLALAATALIRLLRIRPPRALVIHWRVLLLVSFLLPVLQPWHRQTIAAGTDAAPRLPFSPAVHMLMPLANPHWRFPRGAMIAELTGFLILLGVIVRFAFFVLGLLKLQQLRRASSPIPPGVACAGVLDQARTLVGAQAEFRVSTEVDSPVTFGFSAPVILLPERFLRLDAESQAAVACHELLHVHRRDWFHHLGEEILRVGFWFHPAILWVVSRVRLSREQVVDLEVIRLTRARRSYVKALLEFASRNRVTAVPAPPFLVERQLVERVSLMLKEVRMSRTRLVVSLSAVVVIGGAVAILAVSAFPLKASSQAPSQTTAFVAPLPTTTNSLGIKPVVNANAIWTDQVKRGDMPVQVRGRAILLAPNQARLSLPELLMTDVHVGEPASVDTRDKSVKGHVGRVSDQVVLGVRTADITLESPLPTRTALVDGMVQTTTLPNVIYVGLPAQAAHSKGPIVLSMFKIIDNGTQAQRVNVRFDHASATTIQVLSGLEPGDTIILSDMSKYDQFSRIQIAR
ncbi:MAG TPA: M56 family metallopeptidase [Candidatus Acidoferrum sp.]|nr:M56 family metallopeptidase [Candidatus Acidoferrum sp.]